LVPITAFEGYFDNEKQDEEKVLTLEMNGLLVLNKLRHNMLPPLFSPVGALAPRAPQSRRNVAVLSHAEYIPTLTAAAALRVKAALSKAACDLDLWPFDLKSGSLMWRGLSLRQFWSS